MNKTPNSNRFGIDLYSVDNENEYNRGIPNVHTGKIEYMIGYIDDGENTTEIIPWDQMCNERKTQTPRRLGFPNTRGV